MSIEPLQFVPVEKWDELKSIFKTDWPRGLSGFTVLETEKYILECGIDYGFKVFCPYGEGHNGIVAFNIKGGYYEVVIQCPKDDTTELERALRTTKLIDWTKIEEIPFAPKHIMECVKRIILDKNRVIEHITVTETYLLDEDSPLFDVSLPPDFSFKFLSLDYVDMIDNCWPHKYPGSKWYFDLLIKANLGYGLYKGDELVAWTFIKEMGALGHLYTMENHRRKGYGEIVLKLISNLLLKSNKHVFALCAAGNFKAANLYQKLGFKSVGDVTWCNLKSMAE